MSKLFERAIDKINKNINPDLAKEAGIPYQADSAATDVAGVNAVLNALLAKIRTAGLMKDLYTYPEPQSVTVLGKQVSALQSATTAVTEGLPQGEITGTLNWVTDYTQFSGDPDLQKGNYLVLHFDYPTGSIVKSGLTHGINTSLVTLDSDKNMVYRITNKDMQQIIVAFFDASGNETERFVYGLTGLTCTAEPEEEDE